MYEQLCVSTKGFSHIEEGLPCEDYGLVKSTDQFSVFSVADGHGDSNCPRSQFGAKTACEVAVAELETFWSDITNNNWEQQVLDQGEKKEKLFRQLISSIVGKWSKRINDDIKERPLTDEEMEGCDEYLYYYERGERIEHVYGTTLTAGLLTDKFLLLLSQGDGRCAVFHADGSVNEPIPWDEKCIGNVTTSICDEDAVQRCRFSVIDIRNDPIIACLASSDGVEDSFLTIDLAHSFYRALLVEAGECGVKDMEKNLSEKLPEFSRNGSRDDVTICGFIDVEGCKTNTEVLLRDRERVEKKVGIESIIKNTEDQLKSINSMGRMDALREEYETKKSIVENAESELEAVQKEFDEFFEDVDDLKAQKKDNASMFELWDRVVYKLFSESREGAIEKKIKEYKSVIEEKEKELEDVKLDLKVSETEYLELVERESDLEKKKRDAMSQLEALES